MNRYRTNLTLLSALVFLSASYGDSKVGYAKTDSTPVDTIVDTNQPEDTPTPKECTGDNKGAACDDGDPCTVDGACDSAVIEVQCGEDEFVLDHVCVPCPAGSKHAAGADASGEDTVCSVPPLTAGGPGAAVLDPYEEVITLPACDANDPAVRFISSDGDWAHINDPAYRVFCVHPGDYRQVGKIELIVSGEATAPRVIRRFDPTDPDTQIHPVKMAAGAQAIIQRLRFKVVDHWVVEGLSILNNDPDQGLANATVDIAYGSSHNVLHRLLIEGGTSGVQITKESNYNLLQRCVVRNTYILKKDAHCIFVSGAGQSGLKISGNRFVSNEIYNCTNGLQFHINAASLGTTFPGTVVANNDVYLTSDRYTDCEGNLDPHGDCAAGEVGLTFKGGGTSADPAERVHVTRNRVWGWRKTDPTGLGGSGSWGDGVAACCYPTQYLLYDDNVIYDCDRGLGTSHAEFMSVIDSVIAHIEGAFSNSGTMLYAAGQNVEFYRNIFSDGGQTALVVGEGNDFRCNTVMGMTKVADVKEDLGTTADYNAFFGLASPALSGPNTLVFDSPDDAQNGAFCYERRILTGPEAHCIGGVQPTLQSPHLGFCDPALGAVAGVGIDDKPIPD